MAKETIEVRFGRACRKLREAKTGLSQEAFARECGLDRTLAQVVLGALVLACTIYCASSLVVRSASVDDIQGVIGYLPLRVRGSMAWCFGSRPIGEWRVYFGESDVCNYEDTYSWFGGWQGRTVWGVNGEVVLQYTRSAATGNPPWWWGKADQAARTKDMRGAQLVDLDMSGLDLSGSNLSGSNLLGSRLHGANLAGCNFSKATISGCVFERASLHSAQMCDMAQVAGHPFAASFVGSDMRESRLDRSNLAGCDFSGADLRGAIAAGTDVSGANLASADVRDADLEGAVGLTIDQFVLASAWDVKKQLGGTSGGTRVPLHIAQALLERGMEEKLPEENQRD